MTKVGRNDPCPCGSGKKYKQCHLEKDEAAEREARQKAAAEAPAAEAAPAEDKDGKKEAGPEARPHGGRGATAQPWKKGGAQATRGHARFAGPRRSGGS